MESPVPTDEPSAPVLTRVVLLVNPSSGKGRASKAAPIAVQRLQERGFEVVTVIGSDYDDALERLRRAVAEEPTAAVVSCGGDGTVHLCLQVVAESGVPLGILPAGTGNDNASMHGAGKDLDATSARSTQVHASPPTARSDGFSACCPVASTPWSTSGPTG